MIWPSRISVVPGSAFDVRLVMARIFAFNALMGRSAMKV
jgi:hypothetical protein